MEDLVRHERYPARLTRRVEVPVGQQADAVPEHAAVQPAPRTAIGDQELPACRRAAHHLLVRLQQLPHDLLDLRRVELASDRQHDVRVAGVQLAPMM
jgi:hypothetical protein